MIASYKEDKSRDNLNDQKSMSVEKLGLKEFDISN